LFYGPENTLTERTRPGALGGAGKLSSGPPTVSFLLMKASDFDPAAGKDYLMMNVAQDNSDL
jgi:hypothetical protein